jgi:hypothetical protein
MKEGELFLSLDNLARSGLEMDIRCGMAAQDFSFGEETR